MSEFPDIKMPGGYPVSRCVLAAAIDALAQDTATFGSGDNSAVVMAYEYLKMILCIAGGAKDIGAFREICSVIAANLELAENDGIYRYMASMEQK